MREDFMPSLRGYFRLFVDEIGARSDKYLHTFDGIAFVAYPFELIDITFGQRGPNLGVAGIGASTHYGKAAAGNSLQTTADSCADIAVRESKASKFFRHENLIHHIIMIQTLPNYNKLHSNAHRLLWRIARRALSAW